MVDACQSMCCLGPTSYCPQARNILLKSSGGAEGRPFVAKVADFGLSMRIDPDATHVSNVFQGTLTHMVSAVELIG